MQKIFKKGIESPPDLWYNNKDGVARAANLCAAARRIFFSRIVQVRGMDMNTNEKQTGAATIPQRSAGVLLHIASLPGKYGIGTMGAEARRFADFLHAAGVRYWQALPLVQPLALQEFISGESSMKLERKIPALKLPNVQSI